VLIKIGQAGGEKVFKKSLAEILSERAEELGIKEIEIPEIEFEPMDISALPHIKREDERLINRKDKLK
jgi:hypothetical protein